MPTKATATKKAPVKKAAATTVKHTAKELAEYNPYDKTLTPKHHKIAHLILTKKSCTYNELFDAVDGGVSPRTIGYIKDSLGKCGVKVESHRDAERGTVYRAVPGAKLRHAKVEGTGAPLRPADTESAPLAGAKSAAAKKSAPKSPGTAKSKKKAPVKKTASKATTAKKAAATKAATKATSEESVDTFVVGVAPAKKAPVKKAGAKAKHSGSKRPKR